MSRHSTTIATLAAIALLGLTSCASSDGTNTQGKPEKSPLASLDTCKIMKPQQLEQGGFTFDERKDVLPWEPGCSYESDRVALVIYKNMKYDAKSLGKNGDWEFYKPTQINGRDGATARTSGGTKDSCSTVMSAAGGAVRVYAHSDDVLNPIDGCAESMKIAQQIEPNLPE